MPKLTHSETPEIPTRESTTAPGGTLIVEFTIAPDGSVSDPVVVESDTVPTKDWFNDSVLRSVVKWKWERVDAPCRGRFAVTMRFDD
jgi:outer membrane biosynthesis protein TonB